MQHLATPILDVSILRRPRVMPDALGGEYGFPESGARPFDVTRVMMLPRET